MKWNKGSLPGKVLHGDETMKFTIRKAVQTDEAAICSLVISIGWFQWMKDRLPEDIQETLSSHLALCLADDSHSVYVAETSPQRIVGFVNVHWNPYLIHYGPEGYISELFVEADERGQGVGTRLLHTVTEEARSRGCARLLLLNMRKRESYGRGYYRKHGWIEWEDAAVFIYPIEP
jgi:GNAT superfamily N-acetyltransferase